MGEGGDIMHSQILKERQGPVFVSFLRMKSNELMTSLLYLNVFALKLTLLRQHYNKNNEKLLINTEQCAFNLRH